MDCPKVRQYILEGREGWIVRRHLRRCAECSAFQERLQRAEGLLQSALPFEVPEALTPQFMAMVPQAAQNLRLRDAQRARSAEVREARSGHVLQVLLILTIPLALSLGLYFWRQGLALVLPWAERVWNWLPLVPDALRYWGGQLIGPLLPIRDALLFILSVLIMGLSVEHAVRNRRKAARVQN